MKKLIVVLLCVLLLLCGCAGKQNREAISEMPEQATQPAAEQSVSLYDNDSKIEKSTSGAVRAYPLGDGIYTDIIAMGDKRIVLSASGDVTLLQGEDCQIVATQNSDIARTESGLPVWTSGQGVCYYLPESREVVLLDGKLLEISRIPMPQEAQGYPVVLLERGEVFYCTADQIRAMDIQTGISRLVRSHTCASQELTGAYFNDTVLGCRITDEQGTERVLYLYTDTGKEVAEDMKLGSLYTRGEKYFALRRDGDRTQVLFGVSDSETMCLETEPQGLIPALELGGAVRCANGEEGLVLTYYDFETGKRSAEITLPGLTMPIAAMDDAGGFWFIIDQVLYRWDPALSPVEDSTDYVSLLYTAENPDTQALELLISRAQQLQQDYGIELRLWTDAVEDTGDYTCQPEYRVNTLTKGVDGIENILKELPEGFLTTSGNVRISLVNTIAQSKTPVVYWQGSTCCVIVPADMAIEGFLWGMGNAIDARLLGNSRKLDNWSNHNPRGFEYTYDYAANLARENADEYLNYFVDRTAMSFPTEDRCRVFMAAMLDNNSELFHKEALQDKLISLCKAIREACDLEDSTTIFPWEQYLQEPLAAKE